MLQAETPEKKWVSVQFQPQNKHILILQPFSGHEEERCFIAFDTLFQTHWVTNSSKKSAAVGCYKKLLHIQKYFVLPAHGWHSLQNK